MIKAKIRTENGFTDSFPINTGVLQGESASSVLFNHFIYNVVTALHDGKLSGVHIGSLLVHILLYADDQVLIANNKDELQDKINILSETLKEMALQVNYSKTKVIIFQKSRKTKERTYKFTWDNNALEIVNSYTYLLVPFQNNGTFRRATNSFQAKATSAASQVWDIC